MFRYFEKLIDPYQPYDESAEIPDRLIPFLRRFLWPARKVIAVGMALGLVSALVEAAVVKFAADLVDMLSGTTPDRLWAEHGMMLAAMAAVALVIRPAADIAWTMVTGQGFYPHMGALIRWRTHRKMLRQSLSFFADDFSGRIANKQIQLAPAVNDSVFLVTDAIWFALIFVAGAAAVLGGADARILVPLGLWCLAFVGLALWFVPRLIATGKDVAEARSTLAGRIVDAYSNIQTVKLFSHAEREEAYAREAIDDFRWTFARQMRLYVMLQMGLSGMHVLLYGGVVGYTIWLWTAGAVSAGIVAASVAVALRLTGLVDWIMQTVTMLFQNIGTIQEGMDTVSQPLRLKDRPDAPPLRLTEGEIRYEGVTHRYGGSGGGVAGIDLTIAGGERVGLVGRSGAGKSTLVNLALRFYDPDRGRVLIDGQDIAGVRQESVRAHIAMVTQDTSLLHRSIAENIRYGRPDATDEELWRAARQVQADGFIPELVDQEGRRGMEAHVGERGVRLSGGQRQRIALARAVLKDAPILILDEATSALDSEVEADIQSALYDFMAGRTVIAIAHRLSTIRRMDRIVVMDAGRIVEEGTHDALLAQGGLYARFWGRQAGGLIGVEAAE